MSARTAAVDDKHWKRLRYRGAPIKQYVLSEPPRLAAPFGNTVWEAFKQQSAAEGNILPQLISESEPQAPPPGMFRRRGLRKPKGNDLFEDLPLALRPKAEAEFARLCDRWDENLPSWRRAILAGVARRLTLHPPDSEWGRRMRRIKGGVHCQRKYREQGTHPLARLNQATAKRHSARRPPQAMAKRRKQAVESQSCARHKSESYRTPAAEARERLGITPGQMRGVPRITPLLEPVQGGIEQVIEALRWSEAAAAVAFLQKYDSVPRADLRYLSLEELCVAAGVDTRQLFSLAVDRLVYLFLSRVRLQLCGSSTNVLKVTLKNALKAKNWRERKLVLQMIGVLPVPEGWTCPLWLQPAAARHMEAQSPKTAWKLSQPPALPGKAG